MSTELKPCPFCGNKHPWEFISAFCAVLRCKCGAEIHGAAVRTVYKMDEIPEALREFAHPAELLVIRTNDGDIEWPEHGYYGIPVTESFAHFGFSEKWNRRTPC